MLECESGLRFNHDLWCGYSPERINPGDREHTLTAVCKITSGSTPAKQGKKPLDITGK